MTAPSPDDTATGTVGPAQVTLPRGRALLRGLAGWLVLAAGLGAAVGVGEVAAQRTDLSATGRQLIHAALITVIVVPSILWLRSRHDRGPLAGLGLGGGAGRALSFGLAVGLVTGIVAWAPALAAGWVRVDGVDVGMFVQFLALNGVVLALFEALPEELALRGYTWTNLRDGWGVGIATVVTTTLFPLTGGASSVVSAGITAVFATDPLPVRLAPGDPEIYFIHLAVFGLALVAARRVPVPGALLIAGAFHWTQLTVTRVVLGGTGWVDSGWDVTFVEPDAVALVLVHIVLGGVVFVLTRRRLEARRRRRTAQRD